MVRLVPNLIYFLFGRFRCLQQKLTPQRDNSPSNIKFLLKFTSLSITHTLKVILNISETNYLVLCFRFDLMQR